MNIGLFIQDLTEEQKQLISYLHELLERNPGVVSKMRYKVPFYFKKTWFCYINPIKKSVSEVELCFVRANELSNESGMLEFKDRKQVAGITFNSIKDLIKIEEELSYIVQEALLLDDSTPYKSKNAHS